MRYAVVIEKAAKNYSAYVPDLPGCVTTGKTLKETMKLLKEAIEFHIEGMLLDGETVPKATTECEYIDVDLAAIESRASRAQT